LTDIRCVKCNRLLGTLSGHLGNGQVILETKCPKCHYLNSFRLDESKCPTFYTQGKTNDVRFSLVTGEKAHMIAI